MNCALKKRIRIQKDIRNRSRESVIDNGMITVITRYHSNKGSRQGRGEEALTHIRASAFSILSFGSQRAGNSIIDINQCSKRLLHQALDGV